MLGINQTVLMVLATVIIAALIGGGALGLLSLGGFQKQQSQIGQGLAAGLSIVLLGDRPRPDHPGMGPAATRPSRQTQGGEREQSIRPMVTGRAAAPSLVLAVAACGDDDDDDAATAPADEPSATEAPVTEAPADTGEAPATGEGITLAINPWTGSAVNANVAKVVLEAELGTPVEFVEIDENATWPGMDDGSIDAVLEVWPSGHAADYETYIDENQTVVDIGVLGPVGQDRLVRADVRRRRASRARDVGGLPGSRARRAVRHRRVGRPRPVPDGLIRRT